MLTSRCHTATGAISSSERVVSTIKPHSRTRYLLVRSTGPESSERGDAENPSYAYSDPVNKFLGQFLPSNKAAKDELADQVDFGQPKRRGLSTGEMVSFAQRPPVHHIAVVIVD